MLVNDIIQNLKNLKNDFNYWPGLMPSVFGDVTGAIMVMPFTIILLYIVEIFVIILKINEYLEMLIHDARWNVNLLGFNCKVWYLSLTLEVSDCCVGFIRFWTFNLQQLAFVVQFSRKFLEEFKGAFFLRLEYKWSWITCCKQDEHSNLGN